MRTTAIQLPPARTPAFRQPASAAMAVVPLLADVDQTMVLTNVTGDVIRKGMWTLARIGVRQTLAIGLPQAVLRIVTPQRLQLIPEPVLTARPDRRSVGQRSHG
jgi:hypothetical protein